MNGASQVSYPKTTGAGLVMGDAAKKQIFLAEEFLFSQKFSDFIVQCGTKSFYAHRVIITAKSQVFTAMLDQPFKEEKERRLIINDFEPKVVEEFLRFIYTERANLDDYAAELFKMSHMYQVDNLNRKCETALIAKLDITNLIDINDLGKLCDSKPLQDKCYSFFKVNRSSLVKTKSDMDKFSDFSLE